MVAQSGTNTSRVAQIRLSGSAQRAWSHPVCRSEMRLCDWWLTMWNCRGSKFLKSWMAFLEEHADLRYPNPEDLQEDG